MKHLEYKLNRMVHKILFSYQMCLTFYNKFSTKSEYKVSKQLLYFS
jgi:hypothetical protein